MKILFLSKHCIRLVFHACGIPALTSADFQEAQLFMIFQQAGIFSLCELWYSDDNNFGGFHEKNHTWLVISGLILGGCSSKMDQFVEPQGTPRPSIEPLPTDTSFAGEEWYDQMEVWQLHREPARAALTPYPSSQQAASGRDQRSG